MKTFLTCILISQAAALNASAAPDLAAVSARIDELVNARLAQEKVTPNRPVSDEIFVRRVYLDVAGRIPTLNETLKFLKNSEPDKRTKLIDELLAGDGYVQNFFNYWADILRMKTQMIGGGQSLPAYYAYSGWLKTALRENKPYDVMVREVVTAAGKTYVNGAVGFYIRDYNMPLDNMAVTTQVFLGTSMVCAQCHNHPFDKWTQMDYYQMAAYSYGMTGTNGLTNPLLTRALYGGSSKEGKFSYGGSVARNNVPKDLERKEVNRAVVEILRPLRYNTVLDESHRKALRLPRDYAYEDAKPRQEVSPYIPASFSKDGDIIKKDESPITAYADWMASKSNPRFSTVIANRLWKKLMGQGIIEPVDEITDSTVPSNPQLMAYLEETMRAFNYDMRSYLRVILNSAAYQREASTKDVESGVPYYFPGPLLRRMSAEQIWDSMVALYKPGPDIPSIEVKVSAEVALRRIEWLDRALNSLKPEELIACTQQVARKQKELASEVRAAQEKLEVAIKSKDEAAMRAARRAISSQRKRIDQAVEALVYDAGFKRFAAMIAEGRLGEFSDDPQFVKEVESVLKAKKTGESFGMDEALDILSRQRHARLKELAKNRRNADAERLEVNDKNSRDALVAWEGLRDTTMLRAADLRSPAPNGHFLRVFGQSDRELVENANKEASVGQALMLLNGKTFSSLMNRYTMIARAMERAKKKGADALIDTVYLSLMSRPATPEEHALLKPVADKVDATDRGDVLWTVLNTRQFFFIQ